MSLSRHGGNSASGLRLRVARASVVGSRRLLTHMCTPVPAGGRAGGGHALSREVHPPEDRGAASRAAGVPDRDLGLRHGTHGTRGSRAVQRVERRREDRLSRSRTPSASSSRNAARPSSTSPTPAPPTRLAALRRSRTATDEAVAKIRQNAKDPDVRDAIGDGDERASRRAVLDAFDGIESLRRSVEDGTVDPRPGPRPLQPPGRPLLRPARQPSRRRQRRDGQAVPRPRQHHPRPRTALPRGRPARLRPRRRQAHHGEIRDSLRPRRPAHPDVRRQPAAAARRGARTLRAVLEERRHGPAARAPSRPSSSSADGRPARGHGAELGRRRGQACSTNSPRSTTRRATAIRTASDPVAVGVIVKARRRRRPRPGRPAVLALPVRARRPRPHPRPAPTAPGGPRGVRRAAAQRACAACPRANRSTWRPRSRAWSTTRTRSARSARPSTPCSAPPSRPPSNRPNCAPASPRCSSTSPAAARSCCTSSSPCSTPWSAGPRTPTNSPTCSASTTSPPACAGTPRAW